MMVIKFLTGEQRKSDDSIPHRGTEVENLNETTKRAECHQVETSVCVPPKVWASRGPKVTTELITKIAKRVAKQSNATPILNRCVNVEDIKENTVILTNLYS